MKIKYFIVQLISFTMLLGIALQSQARLPAWTLIPSSSSTISVPQNQTTSITYTVTNQLKTPHTLAVYKFPKGISQNISPGYCSNSFTLKSHESCELVLDIDGSLIKKRVVGGPILCQTNPNGTPNASQCYQPSKNDRLDITKTPSQFHYSYVPTGFLGSVYVCTVNPNGTYNTCNTTPSSNVPSWQPSAITFATFSGVQYGYVATGATGTIYRCVLNVDGSLSDCNPTIPSGPHYAGAQGISFAMVNGTQYAYVSDDVDSVFYCTLNSDGTFNTCSPTPSSAAPTWRPLSVTFTTASGTQYAYVANPDGGVLQCSLNPNGTFNVCNVTPSSGAPNWSPSSIAFATVSGVQYAYVGDFNGNLYQCTVLSDGSLNSCGKTPTVAPTWTPVSVAVETFSGKQYAYIAASDVYQCSINSNGALSNCNSTPSSDVPMWVPFWVAFARQRP